MARPRSEDKREAILAAAIGEIAGQGLGAATATIARAAGVANGSLFLYFETKSDLLNALYIELKEEMAKASLEGLPKDENPERQMRHIWSRWVAWATANPEKRRTLLLLGTSDEITQQSRHAGHRSMADIAQLMERIKADGPMRDANLAFVSALMNAMADATIDFILNDPSNAEKHCKRRVRRTLADCCLIIAPNK